MSKLIDLLWFIEICFSHCSLEAKMGRMRAGRRRRVMACSSSCRDIFSSFRMVRLCMYTHIITYHIAAPSAAIYPKSSRIGSVDVVELSNVGCQVFGSCIAWAWNWSAEGRVVELWLAKVVKYRLYIMVTSAVLSVQYTCHGLSRDVTLKVVGVLRACERSFVAPKAPSLMSKSRNLKRKDTAIICHYSSSAIQQFKCHHVSPIDMYEKESTSEKKETCRNWAT